ncbi:diaminobutyrate acetyltransferase [Paenibacillus sp. IB182496]|uniref:L-2,4-diaminobutyric acid acetyltransferase n=1 Tax=Paenibacillus sabuli TaxID=2772509 RepID=A0A927BUB5_9BACL|nr:diaminobutyrate acetyltransferase [Paenibacillus sabuli]MBD2845659.1 diaminobutyrate acetyltransferase [Paenibacillus sabuli]
MSPSHPISLRPPTKQDGTPVWELIQRAGTLDLNSTYCYLLLCDLYADTCMVAEQHGRLVGFVSALLRPDNPEALFVWQVAVDPEARGQGLAKRMLTELLARPQADGVRYVEATIGPSNAASRALFRSLAKVGDCSMEESHEQGYGSTLFPAGQHEDEPLIRVGPLARRPS